ncbi:MAG TPA: PAS domain S-box protein [Methylomirabilota bacterium]
MHGQATEHPPGLYRRLVESILDYAIFTLDAAGHVRSWSPGAQRLKGYTVGEILGRHFSVFYPPDDVAADKPGRELEVAARDGRLEDEGWRVRRDGSRFWANVIISAMRDDGGEVVGFAKVTRDLTDRRNAEEMLRLSEERSRLLVQSVTDYAIIMLDPAGRVASWNDGARRIKGYTAEEVVGQSFERFYPAEAVAAGFPQHELEVAARDGRFENENWRLRKDGSRFWGNVIITAMRDAEGRLLGFAKITRDLTARREAEAQARRLTAEQAAHAEAVRRGEELAALNTRLQAQAAELEAQAEAARMLTKQLQQANDELQAALAGTAAARDAAEQAAAAVTEAYRELDQFAYVASHDLKAPLRGIANLAQWIQDDVGDRLDPQSTEHMRLLQGRVHRMEALIDGILAYSRAGRLLGHPEPVDTSALVREVVDLLAPPAGVTIQVAEGMPTLEAERVPLQQVFMNLIGNAVKYTRAHRPDVVVRVDWQDAGAALQFAVTDNGPGIAPQYHERIWGIFQTLTARDKVEGTGIGLSLVRKVVETRRGRAWVESAPGQGAAFCFTWPKTPPGVRP